MGDRRFEPSYHRVDATDDPVHAMERLSDDAIIEALAAASRERDAYLANVLATEALNRLGRVRTAVDHLAEGVIAVDVQGRVRLCNPAAERILARPQEDALGRDLFELYPILGERDEPIPRDARPFARALRGDVVEGEFATRRANGERLEIGLTAAPILREGEIVGAIMAFHDVTMRRRQARMLEAFMAASLDAVVAIDADSRVQYWNPAATGIFGYSASEAQGRDLATLVIPERFRAAHYAGVKRYLATDDPRIAGRRYRLPAMRKGGAEFPAEISIVKLDVEGATFVGFVRDLSASTSH